MHAMSDPEKAKESASRSDEERKKALGKTISKTATKYGFDSSEAYLAAVKKLEDDDEVKELREQIEQLRKNKHLENKAIIFVIIVLQWTRMKYLMHHRFLVSARKLVTKTGVCIRNF